MPTPGEHTCGEHPFLTFPARRLRSATLRPRVRNAMLQNDFLEITVKDGLAAERRLDRKDLIDRASRFLH